MVYEIRPCIYDIYCNRLYACAIRLCHTIEAKTIGQLGRHRSVKETQLSPSIPPSLDHLTVPGAIPPALSRRIVGVARPIDGLTIFQLRRLVAAVACEASKESNRFDITLDDGALMQGNERMSQYPHRISNEQQFNLYEHAPPPPPHAPSLY